MTDYSSITTGTGSVSTSSSSSSTTAAAVANASSSYTTFIKLLTTQLQNQDPLNPTDTDTFTSEMIQLSEVEQQLSTNTHLASIQSDLTSITATNGVGYIGKTVTASGNETSLQDGKAKWTYTLPKTASDVTLKVTDSDGNTVYSADGDPTAGTHTLSWSGSGTTGTSYTSGDYKLTVSATDSSGNKVTTTTDIVGTVTGVSTSNGTVTLQIGDVDVSLDDVTAINT